MVTSLAELSALIQDGSVPGWLREKVSAEKGNIIAALAQSQVYTLTGPNGEEITIQRAEAAAAA